MSWLKSRLVSSQGRISLFMDLAKITGKATHINNFISECKNKANILGADFIFDYSDRLVFSDHVPLSNQRVFVKASMTIHGTINGQFIQKQFIINNTDHEALAYVSIAELDYIARHGISELERAQNEERILQSLLSDFGKYLLKSYKEIVVSFGYPYDETKMISAFSLFLGKDIADKECLVKDFFEKLKQDIEVHCQSFRADDKTIIKKFVEDPQVCYYYMVSIIIYFHAGAGKAKVYDYSEFLKKTYK